MTDDRIENPLFYTGAPIDRAAHNRKNSQWIAERLSDPDSRFLILWRNRSLVWAPPGDPRRLRPNPSGEAPVARAVVWDGPRASRMLRYGATSLYLGQDTTDDQAWFAIDISHMDEAATRDLEPDADFRDLWEMGSLLDAGMASLCAWARGMMFWHRRHQFCGACGSPTEMADAGHVRRCTNDTCAKEHFPRTDPAVIMLVTGQIDGVEMCLLGRQANWPPRMYSTLAGFVEPGESLEETVIREVHEEVGITVHDVRYMGSQPWPFPTSLMLGFRARALTSEIDQSIDELEDAKWVSRADIAARRDTGLVLPRRHSIARALVDHWFNAG